MKNASIGIAAAVIALAALFLGFQAGSGSRAIAETSAGAPIDRAAVENIIHDYLVKNPEVLLEAQTALEAKQAEAQKSAATKTIAANKDQIFHSPDDAVLGNPKGDVTIVEFYDYNCPYCKHALPDMNALISGDPNLRFVLKEFPILGEDSLKAHVVAEAFRELMPEKYAEFHQELLGQKSRADEASAIALAVQLGADEPALREKMKSPEIGQIFKANYQLAGDLNITGTPSYVVGDEVVPGALGLDSLAQKVANMRSCRHATC